MEKTKLPPELITRLREDQRALHDILTEFDNYEKCGGDCSDYRAAHAKASEQIANLLELYGK